MSKGIIGAIVSGFVVIIGIILLAICTCKVPAGYVAVQYNMNGGIQDEVLTQGWHLVSPTVKTSLYTVGLEQSYLTKGNKGDSEKNERFTACSSEGKAIDVDLTFTYQFDAENITDVFTKFKGKSGEEVRDSFIKPNVISWTKEILSKHKIADILGAERANINAELTTYLAEKIKPYHVTISNVSLINVGVDSNTQKAINEKIKAQQEAERQAIENQKNIDKANADATVKKTNAQADADALKISSEAEAAANKRIRESITDEIIEQKWIEKWDGKMPTYMAGKNGSVMMNMGK